MKSELRKVRKIIGRVKEKIRENNRKVVNVGFVGCGGHATTNLFPALGYASMNLVAVCANHLANAERQAVMFGAETAYDDYRELLDHEKIDALLVCANADLHYKAATEALQRDLPVFVEKPPAPDSERAGELVELSDKKNKCLMVGFNKRFASAYQGAFSIIGSSEFGRLRAVSIRAYFGGTRGENDLLSELGIHYIDLLRYLGGDIRNVQVMKNSRGSKVTISITCEMNGGAIGSLNLSNCHSWAKSCERVECLGDESLLIVEDGRELTFHKPTIVTPGTMPAEHEKTTVWSPNYSVPAKENHLIFQNGYVGELLHFSEVVSGRAKCISRISDGCQALRIIEDIISHG